MSVEEQRRELWDLRWRITMLRWQASTVSPASAELLKAAERVLVEEVAQVEAREELR